MVSECRRAGALAAASGCRRDAVPRRTRLWAAVCEIPRSDEHPCPTRRDGRGDQCGPDYSLAQRAPAGQDSHVSLCCAGAYLRHALKTPLLSVMPLDLLSRFPGVGAGTSELFSTTKIMKVVSHRPQREHDRTPRGRLPYRQSGHVLSLTGLANSIRRLNETQDKVLLGALNVD